MNSSQTRFAIWTLVLVSALGYFVDVFDILLFSVVRTMSLKDLGVAPDQLLNAGITLINSQMIGMLIGGILWGVYGDKKGRLSVLFGSIFLYSVANIANGFAHSVDQYMICRFFAGLGLAGELGAGITLVVETLPKEKRGIGTMVVATGGMCGGFLASLITKYWDWRTAYFIAGGLGIFLLILRISVSESGMFQQLVKRKEVPRGNLIHLLSSKVRVLKFISCIFAGLPIYFVLGILVLFAPELGEARGLGKTLTAGDAVFFSYIGFIVGDIGSGFLSQVLRSRKKVIYLFTLLTIASCYLLLFLPEMTLDVSHLIYGLIGLCAGHWSVTATVAAEQFGTNLRATVATSVPNLIRGAVVPLTLIIRALIPTLGLIYASAMMLGLVTIAALLATRYLKETFALDLDYFE